MKQWKTIVALAAVLLALGGLATWDEWQSKRDEEEKKSKNRLTLLKPEEIEKIEYRNLPSEKKVAEVSESGDETGSSAADADLAVTLTKRDGKWELQSPVQYAADQSSVDSFLKTLTDYTYSQEISAEPAKWGDFGLKDPKRTIILTPAVGSKESPLTVFVGDKAPVGYNVYFRTSKSDKVYLGSQHLLISTAKSLFDFENKGLISIDFGKLTSLKYERQGSAPVLIEKAGDNFALKLPEPAEGDNAEVQSFVSELNSLRAASIDHHPTPQLVEKFTTPQMAITWQTSPETSQRLALIKEGGKWFAATEPTKTIFGLSDEPEKKLTKDPIYFRNRRVLSSDILNVKSVEIDGTPFQNVDGNWYTPENAAKIGSAKDENAKEKNADTPKQESHISTFMVDLEFAKTDSFLSPTAPEVAKYTSTPPRHRIKFIYENKSKKPVTLELFDSDNKDKYFVKRSDQATFYRVAHSAFQNMVGGPKASSTESSPSEEMPELPLDGPEDPEMNLSAPEPNGAG